MQSKFLAPVVLAATLATSFAHASDGTIYFNGTITDTTCTIKVNNETKDATVTLPTVSALALSEPGKVAGTTPFVIHLTNCNGSAPSAAAYFEPGPNVDLVSGNLKNTAAATGAATGVMLQLVDAATTSAIKAGDFVGQSTGNTKLVFDSAIKAPATRSGDLNYAVQYIAGTTAVKPGKVSSSVTYSINYQ